MKIRKYLQIIKKSAHQFFDEISENKNHFKSSVNGFSLGFLKNPNKHLINIKDWNTDLKLEEDQIMFLKINQKLFLNLDIWYWNQHEVRV